MSAQSPANQLVGAVLNGRWRLVRLLGEGGMGAVFEADGPPGAGKRAIKLLHQEYVKEERILARFFAEAQATRTLNHPNVVQVLETATAENGTPYLVMELLQGVPVASYVDQRQVLPPAQAVHLVHGVLQALAAAHARGIVHRDIKPDNLFLVHDANGSFHTKVLDFGIAKVMDVAGGMGQKTRTGVLLGTPGYMSPEQIRDSKGVDARTDLWSVGIIFYELLTGASPFPAENDFARLTTVLTEDALPIESVAPHLASWSAFMRRSLAKDPGQRFQSADEMAAALVSVARGPSAPMEVKERPSTGYSPPLAFMTTSPQDVKERPSTVGHAAPLALMTTTPMDVKERPSAAGHSPLMTTSPMEAPRDAKERPSAVVPVSALVQPQASSYPGTMGAVSHGSVPPPPSRAGTTHVSAQQAGGALAAPGYTPSIDVVAAAEHQGHGAVLGRRSGRGGGLRPGLGARVPDGVTAWGRAASSALCLPRRSRSPCWRSPPAHEEAPCLPILPSWSSICTSTSPGRSTSRAARRPSPRGTPRSPPSPRGATAASSSPSTCPTAPTRTAPTSRTPTPSSPPSSR